MERLWRRRIWMRSGLVILAVLAALSADSCDLSCVLGGCQSEYIQSYAVDTADNPQLGSDETAQINGTDLYLTLPYMFAVEGVAVTPSVSFENGGSSIEPSGTYAVKDGMPLTVTAKGKSYSYTLHVGVDPSTVATPPLISSFVVTAAANPSLTQDETAVLYGDGVYVTLPYSVITEGVPLTPTVAVPSGFTFSPSGSWPFADGKQLEVTETANSQLYLYTLHVAADPATSPPLPPLQLFELAASQNTAPSQNEVAVISGTDIYITVPYAALSGQTPLTVTVALESGWTITPSGSYVLSDGMPLTVVNTTTNTIVTYTLHVAVSTSTVP